MSAIKPGPPTKLGQGGLPTAPNNQAILLDKLNRRSTPDSEALASSDDEGETHRTEPLLPISSSQPPRPVRRASWLNDTSQASVRPRIDSFAGASMSPTSSHPIMPSTDAGAATAAWNAHSTAPGNVLNRAHTSSASFAWGTGIWNTDRKDPLSRLSEVLPSPTSVIPPGSAGSSSFFSSDIIPSQTSPVPREHGVGTTSQIPFAIPLHPTPKTYRSQSYSVGQLDADAAMAAAVSQPSALPPASLAGSRVRPMTHAGLHHRPSRPSMLSEMSSEGGMLGKVKEVDDDDDESTNDSSQGSQQLSVEAKTIEMLARENAILRQQANQQYHNARIRPRASTAAAYGIGNGYGFQESVPEESEFAVDELDEAMDSDLVAATKRAAMRRMSEYGAARSFQSPYALENRKLENVKKAFWQSAPGFPDNSPSRRHSFADIPTRQASISSISEVVLAHEAGSQDAQTVGSEFSSSFSDAHGFSSSQPAAQSLYTTGAGATMTSAQQAALQHQQPSPLSATYGSGAYPSPYGLHAPPFSGRPTSPQRGMYGMTQPNRSTPLHIVLFKCARADVFYIQEGTGLTVKPGDLVIVEADRGTDLGTVAVDNVDWVEARRLKEHYAEEQYKWLMMYSQNAAAAQDGVGAGLMASSTGLQGSAVGGMGPPGQHHMQEPNAGELKPKLIKRLAQNHEIHALRDKEGNEAKAKRVCMQKVKEHGLNMEILDAEFQMDWKKLTFYYFADAYINFNSLVTDLFKIYKTRIWMSAINPASFASQPLGLQAPSGIGPGAVGVRRSSTSDRRHTQHGEHQQQQSQQQQQQQQQQPSLSAYPPSSLGGRGYQGSVSPQPPLAASVTTAAASAAAAIGNYPAAMQYNPYAAFGNIPRAPGIAYGQGGMPLGADGYSIAYASPGDYQSMRGGRFPAGQAESAQHGQGLSPIGVSGDWVGSFQGLSLNSR